MVRSLRRVALFAAAIVAFLSFWAQPASAEFNCLGHGGTAYAIAGDGFVLVGCNDGYWFIY